MAAPPFFECRDLSTEYSPCMDLRLEAGRLAGIHGPSGSGKTTLLLAMADLLPHSGRCLLRGRPALQHKPEDWRRRVLYLPPRSHLRREPFPELLEGEDRWSRALGIDGRLQAGRSAGEDQRLLLLRALRLEPEVLLLDELGAHLDPERRKGLPELLRDWLSQGERAAVWVSHDEQLLAACDQRLELGRKES